MDSVISYDVSVSIDGSVYDLDVVLRASYRLTDRFYVFVSRAEGGRLVVALTPKANTPPNLDPRGELSNTLIDEAVRRRVRIETSAIREHIVRCALAEAAPDE